MIARGRPPRAAGRTVVSRFEFFMRLKESINGVRDARPQIAAGCCTAANGAKGTRAAVGRCCGPVPKLPGSQ